MVVSAYVQNVTCRTETYSTTTIYIPITRHQNITASKKREQKYSINYYAIIWKIPYRVSLSQSHKIAQFFMLTYSLMLGY